MNSLTRTKKIRQSEKRKKGASKQSSLPKKKTNGNDFKPLEKALPTIRELHVHTLSEGSSAQLVSYDSQSGLYTVGDKPIQLAGQGKTWSAVKDYHINQILKAVKLNAPVIQGRDLNDPKHQIVVFKNGILDLRRRHLKQHSPEYFYTIGIPHNYHRKAQCPRFGRFVKEILPSECQLLLGQIMGYLLIPSTAYRKFFVFLGSGANGKSTLIQVIEAMLGSDNCCHQSLHYLAKNRFAPAALFGKLVNTYADLDSEDVEKTGLLKQIVSGDSIDYEKKFKQPFSGPVTARLVFSANRMPVIKDSSKAMTDRIGVPTLFRGDSAGSRFTREANHSVGDTRSLGKLGGSWPSELAGGQPVYRSRKQPRATARLQNQV